MAIISMKQLLEAGVHFGHQTRRWNPKMKKYIYTDRNGIYIIDLQKTAKKLDEAYYALQEVAKDGGRVLFVGTKKQAQEAVKEEAIRGGQFWVNQRWLGGTLTNFKTIQARIARLEELETMEQDGTFEVLPKKEGGFPAPPPLSPFSPPDLDRRVDSPALSGRGSRPSGRTSG